MKGRFLESTGPDQEELLEGDQELSAAQRYRETLRCVRLFMAWNDIPEFDSASSSQDDDPFTGSRSSQTGKVSKSQLMNGYAGNLTN